MSKKYDIGLGSIKVQIQSSTRELSFAFEGYLSEDFREEDIPRLKHPLTTIHLGQILGVYSSGIRIWEHWIKSISGLSTLVLKEASMPMVDYWNLNPLEGRVQLIESFYAPYYCVLHGHHPRLIQVMDHEYTLKRAKAPILRCEQCRSELIFAGVSQLYFGFLGSFEEGLAYGSS